MQIAGEKSSYEYSNSYGTNVETPSKTTEKILYSRVAFVRFVGAFRMIQLTANLIVNHPTQFLRALSGILKVLSGHRSVLGMFLGVG